MCVRVRLQHLCVSGIFLRTETNYLIENIKQRTSVAWWKYESLLSLFKFYADVSGIVYITINPISHTHTYARTSHTIQLLSFWHKPELNSLPIGTYDVCRQVGRDEDKNTRSTMEMKKSQNMTQLQQMHYTFTYAILQYV